MHICFLLYIWYLLSVDSMYIVKISLLPYAVSAGIVVPLEWLWIGKLGFDSLQRQQFLCLGWHWVSASLLHNGYEGCFSGNKAVTAWSKLTTYECIQCSLHSPMSSWDYTSTHEEIFHFLLPMVNAHNMC